MTIYANVYGGQLPTVELSGTGTPAGLVTLTPSTISFDPSPGQSSQLPPVLVGAASGSQQVQAGNSGTASISITNIAIASPFTIATNGCGAGTLAPGADCQLMLAFTPTQRGAATGTLTFTEGASKQTVALSGFGWALPHRQSFSYLAELWRNRDRAVLARADHYAFEYRRPASEGDCRYGERCVH
jgi:hypothetical protein